MSKFIEILSKYNSLLSEQDQVDPNAPTLNPDPATDEVPEATPEQVSTNTETAIPLIDNTQVKKVLKNFATILSKNPNYKSSFNYLSNIDNDDDNKIKDNVENFLQAFDQESASSTSTTNE
jgi:hypothetical protein